VRELETELESEQHRHVDSQKSLRKQDRRLQEIILQLDEGQKGQDRLKDVIEKLQQKNKQYKRQVEEAVRISFWSIQHTSTISVVTCYHCSENLYSLE